MKPNIIVVDDEPVTRQTLSDILRLEGYNVLAFSGGEAAVEHLRVNPVDLMVLDLRMPGMGGMDVIQVASQVAPDVEIILLTAYGTMDTALEALRARVHDYLLKPASPQQVVQSVKRGLERHAVRMQQRQSRTINEDTVEIIKFRDGVEIDMQRREIRLGNKSVLLTPAEGHLLKVFLENIGKVFSHRQLVLLVQGYDVSQREAQEILRPLVSRLRHKLVDFKSIYQRIVSVRGTGYIFETEEKTRDK